jgi:hypothetical protein
LTAQKTGRLAREWHMHAENLIVNRGGAHHEAFASDPLNIELYKTLSFPSAFFATSKNFRLLDSKPAASE